MGIIRGVTAFFAIPIWCLSTFEASDSEQNGIVQLECEIGDFWVDGLHMDGDEKILIFDTVSLKIIKPEEYAEMRIGLLIPSDEKERRKFFWDKTGRVVSFDIHADFLKRKRYPVYSKDLIGPKLLKSKSTGGTK